MIAFIGDCHNSTIATMRHTVQDAEIELILIEDSTSIGDSYIIDGVIFISDIPACVEEQLSIVPHPKEGKRLKDLSVLCKIPQIRKGYKKCCVVRRQMFAKSGYLPKRIRHKRKM